MGLEWKASNALWRESGRYIKIGPFDGRLMIFFVIWFLYPSWTLIYIAGVAIVVCYFLNYMGYTFANALRKLRVILGGKTKAGVHYWRQRKFRF